MNKLSVTTLLTRNRPEILPKPRINVGGVMALGKVRPTIPGVACFEICSLLMVKHTDVTHTVIIRL